MSDKRPCTMDLLAHYHLFKCSSLTAVLPATAILNAISKVPVRTDPEKLRAMPSTAMMEAVV